MQDEALRLLPSGGDELEALLVLLSNTHVKLVSVMLQMMVLVATSIEACIQHTV